jgi:hypothetical protein
MQFQISIRMRAFRGPGRVGAPRFLPAQAWFFAGPAKTKFGGKTALHPMGKLGEGVAILSREG